MDLLLEIGEVLVYGIGGCAILWIGWQLISFLLGTVVSLFRREDDPKNQKPQH